MNLNWHEFGEKVNKFLSSKPSDNTVAAKKSLLFFYSFINAKALKVEDLNPSSLLWSEIVYQIHYCLTTTPLLYFVTVFRQSEKLAIRAAAKNLFCDFLDREKDEEARLAENAIHRVISKGMEKKLEKRFHDDRIVNTAGNYWAISGYAQFHGLVRRAT